MKIVINNNRKIFAIQQEFNTLFPGLKLLFYAKPSNPGAASSPKLMLHSSKTLRDCRAVHNEGSIDILPSMNIADLKANFRDIYGLSVEIFQKAGNGANENPVVNQNTLEENNIQYSM